MGKHCNRDLDQSERRCLYSGQTFREVDYTLDTASHVVTAVSNKDYESNVGYHALFLINPASLKPGDTVLLPWVDPTGKQVDVPWTVGVLRNVEVRGSEVTVWSVTYTGESTGHWPAENGPYSQGPETHTYLFDPTYGVLLGYSTSGRYSFSRAEGYWNGYTTVRGQGGWEETSSWTSGPKDTSLEFSAAVTLAIEPSSLSIAVDGTEYSGNQLPKTFDWNMGSTHTLKVDSKIDGVSGVRYVFLEWSDGSEETTRMITASQTIEYKAKFKTQYDLTVTSEFGGPQGAGWYDAGSEVTVSVDSPVPETGLLGSLGAKRVFQEWSGDLTSDSRTTTIKMDGPRAVKAKWTTDDFQAYIVLGGIAAAVIVIIAAALMLGRRKAQPRPLALQPVRRPAPPTFAPPPAARPPPTTYPPGPPAEEGMKRCRHCGATIPSVVVYCTKCGRRQ